MWVCVCVAVWLFECDMRLLRQVRTVVKGIFDWMDRHVKRDSDHDAKWREAVTKKAEKKLKR